ncbi:hypothetical protein ACIBQX_12215 [Nonomuraea sp. NPDC049714]
MTAQRCRVAGAAMAVSVVSATQAATATVVPACRPNRMLEPLP